MKKRILFNNGYVTAIRRHFLRYFNYHYPSIFNPLLVKTQDLLITAQTYV